MKLRKADIMKWVIGFLLVAVAVTIASLTVGRDIYYGSRENGLWSFAIVNAAGYLFFLFMPVELAFIYYLSGDISIWALNFVALGTAILSQSIDYLIGYILSDKIIDSLIGRRRYEKAEDRIRKYGNIAILVFNALPLSSPVISLAAGMLRHRILDALIWTVAGLVMKYLLLTIVFS
ncbi:MAG: VTT domain-containing protein [Bacteroidales bacterium]|jgi:membrane protein DedA with SNARE-associated domain|nr:VTT domain-containing protein [Bacteroidales bacterium]